MEKLLTSDEAAKLIADDATIAVTTFGLSGLAEQIMVGIKERYEQTNHPKNLTFINSSGIGNKSPGRGLDHFVADGLLKRIICGHIALSPLMAKRITDNKVEAYLLPQGVIPEVYQSIASKHPLLLTKTGLNTFVDPRIEGAKANDMTTEDLIKLMTIDDEEWLRIDTFPIDFALIRGTFADTKGNIIISQEAVKFESLTLALAARNSGGKIIAQVREVVDAGSISPKDVVVPGILVDHVVVAGPEYHRQTMGTQYHPGLSNEIKIPHTGMKLLPLNVRKVIARRAAMEIMPDSIVNLGIGMPESVAAVAQEEKVIDQYTLTIELGVIGGTPTNGLDFGTSYNAEAIINHEAMFKYYNGGNLDIAILGLAQVDQYGNINVSKFNGRMVGPGGFINISQNTPKLVFVGTFTVGSKLLIRGGQIEILEEGTQHKFVENVEQITFSAKNAYNNQQDILYVTERAVFELSDGQMRLIEIAPGIDLQTDILDLMDFQPLIAEDLKMMDLDIFQQEWGKLKDCIN